MAKSHLPRVCALPRARLPRCMGSIFTAHAHGKREPIGNMDQNLAWISLTIQIPQLPMPKLHTSRNFWVCLCTKIVVPVCICCDLHSFSILNLASVGFRLKYFSMDFYCARATFFQPETILWKIASITFSTINKLF